MAEKEQSAEHRIQQVLSTSPLVEELRAGSDDIEETRNVFQMGAEQAATNFVVTQLANAQGFAAPPLLLLSVKARTAMAIHYIGSGMAGHPGIVHGGVIATILDEVCGKGSATHFQAVHEEEAGKTGNGESFDPTKGVLAVTAQLTVDFKSPTRSDSIVMTRAVADREASSPRKAIVKAEMWQVDPDSADKRELVATGTALYIRPRTGA